VSTFGHFTCLHLVEGVDALAGRVHGVHQMHVEQGGIVATPWKRFKEVRLNEAREAAKFPRLAFEFEKFSRALIHELLPQNSTYT